MQGITRHGRSMTLPMPIGARAVVTADNTKTIALLGLYLEHLKGLSKALAVTMGTQAARR